MKIFSVFKIEEIRKKLLLTLGILVVFRLAAALPVPGVDPGILKQLLAQSRFLGLMDLLSGGVMGRFSLVTLGLVPYINASIILQLSTFIFPRLKALSREGEYGREKIDQYTRFLTLPLSLLQGLGMYFWLQRTGLLGTRTSLLSGATLLITLMGGTFLLVWLSDLISEYGVGKGTSMIIFAGILSTLPLGIFQTALTSSWKILVPVLLLALLLIMGVVVVDEGAREIEVRYPRGRKGGGASTLPLRINQAGVMPIIFASSLLLFPSMIMEFLKGSFPSLAKFEGFLSPTHPLYLVVYFFLVVFFTYFYSTVAFNPKDVAEDIKKYGGFIPGIRPGRATERHLEGILFRLTLGGALFLGLVAVIPYILSGWAGVNLGLSGTGLLIVVSVILEVVRNLKGEVSMREYEILF